MPCLLLGVQFQCARYHGLDGEGRPEWPPSPARLFQALVAGASKGAVLCKEDRDALAWLEQLEAPIIAAPAVRRGQYFSHFMPNNDLDTVGGDPARISEIRSATKRFHPQIFDGETSFLYVWSFDHGMEHAERMCDIALRLYQLGRGVDMAWAIAEVLDADEADRRPGIPGQRLLIGNRDPLVPRDDLHRLAEVDRRHLQVEDIAHRRHRRSTATVHTPGTHQRRGRVTHAAVGNDTATARVWTAAGNCGIMAPAATGDAGRSIMEKQERPFGLWPSPLTPKGMAGGTRLGDVAWDSDGQTLVWLEGRGDQGVLVCADGSGTSTTATTGRSSGWSSTIAAIAGSAVSSPHSSSQSASSRGAKSTRGPA